MYCYFPLQACILSTSSHTIEVMMEILLYNENTVPNCTLISYCFLCANTASNKLFLFQVYGSLCPRRSAACPH